MNYTADNLISRIVAQDYRTAKVFKKYDIGFCCSGRTSIEDASKQMNVNLDILISELNEIVKEAGDEKINYDSWPIDFLSDYIVKIHHRYAREQIPTLMAYLERIKLVHGDKHPELFEIYHLFKETAIVLSAHMKEEERALFPMFRQLAFQQEVDARLIKAHINNMMEEHENEDEQFFLIESLSNNFTPPKGACNTYRVSFGLLKEFQEDLKKHVHLENNVLFPNALALL